VGYRVWGSKRVTVQEPWVAGYGEARGLRFRSRGLQGMGEQEGYGSGAVGCRVWGSKRVTVEEPWVTGYGFDYGFCTQA